jgi:hypothetical protein
VLEGVHQVHLQSKQHAAAQISGQQAATA